MAAHFQQDLAALATALLWSCSALAWSIAGRRVGSVPVTAIRILLAAAILSTAHWAAFGRPWPSWLDGESLGLLAVSGLMGAGAADLCLFRGLTLIGPRQGMLIQSLSPILTALIALAVMGERLGVQAAGAIAMTVAGVAWVLAEQKGRSAWKSTPADFRRGVAFCVAAAVLVSGGYVLSRMAMVGGPRLLIAGPDRTPVQPFSAALVRVAAGAAATWLALPLMRRTRATVAALADRRAMLIVVAGTIVGPVVGIWLSMIALKGVKSGVAAALINTSPLMLIPIVWAAYGERPSPRTLLGTAVAVGGVFLLMLR